jgi:hypothetical protein
VGGAIDHFLELGAEGAMATRSLARRAIATASLGGCIRAYGRRHRCEPQLAGRRLVPAHARGGRGRASWASRDFVWKWAPNGNARQTNFKLQGEYFRSTAADAARQSGWYLQGIYQFMPGWRVGARYESSMPAR